MGGCDRRDQRDLGANEGGQLRNLARRVHTELIDLINRILRRARKAKRHAPMVVEAFLGRMGGTLFCKD